MKNEVVKKILFMFVVIFIVAGFNEVSNAVLPNVFFVTNEKELVACVEVSNDNDIVVLINDIYLKSDLNIESAIMLDLNGNNLYVLGNDTSITIGSKVFHRKEFRKEIEPGYYKEEVEVLDSPDKLIQDLFGNGITNINGQKTKVTKVWNPPVIEEGHEDSYEYRNDMVVTIKNGKIIHSDGDNGEDGVEDTWSDFNGKDGETPKEPIKMLSGTLKLFDVEIYGGDGGNGGSGKYQSLLHTPLGGGKGGNGGNGAKGGNVISILREECNIFTEKTILVPGKGGKGGESALPNPNSWIYKGKVGQKGNNGLDGGILNLELN